MLFEIFEKFLLILEGAVNVKYTAFSKFGNYETFKDLFRVYHSFQFSRRR